MPNEPASSPAPSLLTNHAFTQSATELVALLPGLKSGVRTTEFWINLIVILAAVAGAFADKLPPWAALLISAIAGSVYHSQRGEDKDLHGNKTVDLLTSLIEAAGSQGRSTALTALAGAIQTPPAAKEETALAALPPLAATTGGYVSRPMVFVVWVISMLGAAILIVLPLFLMSGCETGADGKQHLTAEGKQVLQVGGQILLNAAVAAGESAAAQYIDGGKVDGGRVAAASLQGINFQLRGLEGTPQAADPQAIRYAINSGADNPAISREVAPVIINGVATAIANGVAPDTAVEHAAAQLDAAAVKVAKPKARSRTSTKAKPATLAPDASDRAACCSSDGKATKQFEAPFTTLP